jgi:hypothetical protein
MTITYNKQYNEQSFEHFDLYQNLSFSTSKVFWEYYNLIKSFSSATKEEITEKIKNYKKEAKSGLGISYTEQGIEFFKPNKHIFPEFYILWKD